MTQRYQHSRGLVHAQPAVCSQRCAAASPTLSGSSGQPITSALATCISITAAAQLWPCPLQVTRQSRAESCRHALPVLWPWLHAADISTGYALTPDRICMVISYSSVQQAKRPCTVEHDGLLVAGAAVS